MKPVRRCIVLVIFLLLILSVFGASAPQANEPFRVVKNIFETTTKSEANHPNTKELKTLLSSRQFNTKGKPFGIDLNDKWFKGSKSDLHNSCCESKSFCANVDLIPDFIHIENLNKGVYKEIMAKSGSGRKTQLIWRGTNDRNPLRQNFVDYVRSKDYDVDIKSNFIDPLNYFTQYQNVVVIDGIGSAFRIPSHFAGSQTVVLLSECEQWYSDKLKPWFHYIPLKSDFSNLGDIVSFLQKEPEKSREIGRRARSFFDEHLSLKPTIKYLERAFAKY